ncbi:MAG TPA: hypothetical protein VFC26_03750 [Verrucomicrobiae bacterium]|nr:hypothetical protein [Verrucomicrobiae bacterium]
MSIVGRFRARVVIAVFFAFASQLMAQTQRLDVVEALVNGQATVTYSAIDIGQIGSVFDGNTDTLARTANINPMELYALDATGELQITSGRKSGGNFELTWNTAPSRWYEIQSSTHLANWSSVGFRKAAGNSTTQQVSTPVGNQGFFRSERHWRRTGRKLPGECW